MKERLYSVLKQIGIFLFVGICYYLLITLSDYKLGFKCPLFEFTGLLCPSCGISRMIVEITRLNFRGAYLCNPALFCLSPVYSGVILHYIITFIRTGKKEISTPSLVIVSIATIILIIFGILRNFL